MSTVPEYQVVTKGARPMGPSDAKSDHASATDNRSIRRAPLHSLLREEMRRVQGLLRLFALRSRALNQFDGQRESKRRVGASAPRAVFCTEKARRASAGKFE
jgi:hypothetical protein